MNNELKNISKQYLNANKQVEKLTKEIKQKELQKENEKQYEKDFKKLMNKVLKDYFIKNYFSKRDLSNVYNDLRLTETRNNIIEYIADNEKEFDYLNEIYENVLQKTFKIYKNDYDAKMEIQQNETENNETKTTKISGFMIFACLFSIIPIFLLMFLGLLETLKGWLLLFVYAIIISIIGNLFIIFHKK